jgi:tetratricopeptide (TPR) repeat protein
VIALIFLSLFSPTASAPPDHAGADAEYGAGLAARSNSRQAREHFAKAATAYEEAWDAGERSPELARNLAQSHYLAGDLGRAIRDYRRGLALAPHDRSLRQGLAFAREQVAYPLTGDLEKAARPRDGDSLPDRLGVSPIRLAAIAVALWAVAWFLLARAWMTRRGGLWVGGGMALIAAMALGIWLVRDDREQRRLYSQPAAVVIASAELRLGNSDEYPRRIDGHLPVGVEVRVLGERGGWLHVELADGTAGWLPRELLARVD